MSKIYCDHAPPALPASWPIRRRLVGRPADPIGRKLAGRPLLLAAQAIGRQLAGYTGRPAAWPIGSQLAGRLARPLSRSTDCQRPCLKIKSCVEFWPRTEGMGTCDSLSTTSPRVYPAKMLGFFYLLFIYYSFTIPFSNPNAMVFFYLLFKSMI